MNHYWMIGSVAIVAVAAPAIAADETLDAARSGIDDAARNVDDTTARIAQVDAELKRLDAERKTISDETAATRGQAQVDPRTAALTAVQTEFETTVAAAQAAAKSLADVRKPLFDAAPKSEEFKTAEAGYHASGRAMQAREDAVLGEFAKSYNATTLQQQVDAAKGVLAAQPTNAPELVAQKQAAVDQAEDAFAKEQNKVIEADPELKQLIAAFEAASGAFAAEQQKLFDVIDRDPSVAPKAAEFKQRDEVAQAAQTKFDEAIKQFEAAAPSAGVPADPRVAELEQKLSDAYSKLDEYDRTIALANQDRAALTQQLDAANRDYALAQTRYNDAIWLADADARYRYTVRLTQDRVRREDDRRGYGDRYGREYRDRWSSGVGVDRLAGDRQLTEEQLRYDAYAYNPGYYYGSYTSIRGSGSYGKPVVFDEQKWRDYKLAANFGYTNRARPNPDLYVRRPANTAPFINSPYTQSKSIRSPYSSRNTLGPDSQTREEALRRASGENRPQLPGDRGQVPRNSNDDRTAAGDRASNNDRGSNNDRASNNDRGSRDDRADRGDNNRPRSDADRGGANRENSAREAAERARAREGSKAPAAPDRGERGGAERGDRGGSKPSAAPSGGDKPSAAPSGGDKPSAPPSGGNAGQSGGGSKAAPNGGANSGGDSGGAARPRGRP